MNNTTSGSEPGEGYNLKGAEVLPFDTRNRLRDIPTRAQIKERIMNAADSARGISQSLELTAKYLMSYAATNLNSCDDTHSMITLAKDTDRLGAFKLIELETAVAATLHVLYHHLHELPSEVAEIVTLEALHNWKLLEELIHQEKQKIAANNLANRVGDILETFFGNK